MNGWNDPAARPSEAAEPPDAGDELPAGIGKTGGDPAMFAKAELEELQTLAEQFERAASIIARHGRLRAMWGAEAA